MTEKTEFEIELSRCKACESLQYPPRALCCFCLADELETTTVNASGQLLSATLCHYSLEPEQNETVPNPLGLVQLDAGPTLFVYMDEILPLKQGVCVETRYDNTGAAVYYALPLSKDLDKQA